MCAAGKIAFVEPGLGEQAAHRLHMCQLAAMRGAGDRELVVAEPERVGGAALDQRHGLHRLDGRAGKHRPFDVAEGKQEPTVGIGDSDRARMPALDQRPSEDLDERGIGGSDLRIIKTLGRAHQLRARSSGLAGAPGSAASSVGTPAACFDARMTSEVLTLATLGAAVSSWMMNS